MLKRLLLFLFVISGIPAISQNFRWDYQATATNTSVGNLIPLYVLPNARITFYSGCTISGCPTLASVYNTATSVTACPTNAQVVLNQSTSCGSTADSQGNFGGWFAAGTYQYSIQTNSGTFGPYWFSVGGGGSSGLTLTGPVTGTGTGTIATTITPTGVTPGNYNLGGQIVVISASGQIDSVGNPFSITSFTCPQCGNFEVGYSISSASGAASYTNPSVPTSASVSDGTYTVALTTPFTSWTESHTYTANTTFTLTAVGNSQTQTATQSFQLFPCTFSGITGNATPSSAMAAGSGSGNQCASETVTLGGGGSITSNGLGTTSVGQVFSFGSPGGNYVNLFVTETSPGCNRNPWTFNGSSPVNGTTHTVSSYTNILGGTQTNMCIYTFGPYSSALTLTVAR